VSPTYERELTAAADAVERLLRDREPGMYDRAFAVAVVQWLFTHGWRPTEARPAPAPTGPRAAEYGPPPAARVFIDTLRRRVAGEPVAWAGTVTAAGS
jgi:hypothetical protein